MNFKGALPCCITLNYAESYYLGALGGGGEGAPLDPKGLDEEILNFSI